MHRDQDNLLTANIRLLVETHRNFLLLSEYRSKRLVRTWEDQETEVT